MDRRIGPVEDAAVAGSRADYRAVGFAAHTQIRSVPVVHAEGE